MKRYLFTAMAVAATMAAPTLHAQIVTTQPAPQTSGTMQRHGRGPGQMGGHMGMMAELNLTSTQQAQVEAIHAKYEPQIKAARESLRPQMQAARAARAKGDTTAARADRANMSTAMAPMRKIHDQERAEIRAILTPAQQQKFDAMKTRHGGMGGGKYTGTGKVRRRATQSAPAVQ